MTWDQALQWLLTSIIGGLIVLIFDVVRERFKQREAKKELKIQKILDYIREFGELTELYRFFAVVSGSIVRDEKGNLLKDDEGNYIIEETVLEPKPEFMAAFEKQEQTDINAAITQKIVSIRLRSAEVRDLSLEIDPSGSIEKDLSELFIKTILNISRTLKNKNMHTPDQNFSYMRETLNEADKHRQKLRNNVNKYLK